MLAAELRTVNSCHEFIVKTDEPDYIDVLVPLGYGPLGDNPGEYLRRFPLHPEVEHIFDRFAQSLRPMLDQMSRRVETPWEAALELLCARAAHAGLEWFLIGSASIALRGIDVKPRDVDFVVPDQAQALAVYGDLLVNPPLFHTDTTFVGLWSGRAFAGARVEWVSFVHPTLDMWRRPNELGPDTQANLERIQWRDWVIRVPPLTTQLTITEQRGLEERAQAIKQHLAIVDG
jgi:hypothetical protein